MPLSSGLFLSRARCSVLLTIVLAMLLLPACSTQKGTVEGQVLGITASDRPPTILSGAMVQVSGSQGDQQPAVTGSDGKFRLSLPYDNYTILATANGFEPRQKTVRIDSDQIETVGFVLVAPGLQQPQSPPPLSPEQRQALSSGSYAQGGSSVIGGTLSDPWFWLYMFDRPYVYGYPRVPFVGYGGFGGGPSVIVLDRRSDPLISGNQRGYVTYRDPAGPPVTGTKPAPVPQPVSGTTGSKGSVKPSTGGGSGLTSPRSPAPIAPPGRAGSGSQGTSPGGNPPSLTSPRSPAPIAPPPGGSSGITRPPSSGGSSGISRPPSSGITRPAPVAPPSRGGSYRGGGSKGRR